MNLDTAEHPETPSFSKFSLTAKACPSPTSKKTSSAFLEHHVVNLLIQ